MLKTLLVVDDDCAEEFCEDVMYTMGVELRVANPADLAEALFGEDFADTLERVRFQADDYTHRMQFREDAEAYRRFVEALERVRKSQPEKGESDAR